MVAKENTGQVDFIKAFKMYSTLRHVGTRLPKLIYTMTNLPSTRMGVCRLCWPANTLFTKILIEAEAMFVLN